MPKQPQFLCDQCNIIGRSECCWPKECPQKGQPREGLVARLREAMKLALDQLTTTDRRQALSLLEPEDIAWLTGSAVKRTSRRRIKS